MGDSITYVESRLGETNLYLQGISVIVGQVPPGTMWYSKEFNSAIVNRFSDMTYPVQWPKFLQEQRELARRSLAAKVVQTRFELGIPLYYR